MGACGAFSARCSQNLLDLHGLPVEVAKLVTQTTLLRTAASGQRFPHSKDHGMTLIVGQGWGSDGGLALLRAALLQLLRGDYGLVEVHVDRNNPGRIIVPAAALARFAA